MPCTLPNVEPPLTEMEAPVRRVGQTKIGTAMFMAPVAWNWVRLMLLIVKFASGPVAPSLAGVYIGNVLAPFGIGVVNSVRRLFCSMYGRMSGAQEML